MPILYTKKEILTKLKLCELLRSPVEDNEFNSASFKDRVINSHPTNPFLNEYAVFLYYYGVHTRRLYESLNTPAMQKIYQEHEQIYSQVLEVREQLQDILEKIEMGEMPQFYVTNEQGKKRKQIFSLEEKQSDLRELIVSHYKESLCKLYNEHKGTEEKQLTSSDITLEYLKEWSIASRELYENEVGTRIGRPLNLEMLFSHRCIQELSFLLRIDALLEQENLYTKLSDINLTADDYRFIYNFLEYFSLLFYDKAEIVTTQPDDIIKSRHSSFGKGTSLPALVKDMKGVEENIYEFGVQYKMNQFINKGI